MAEDESQPKNLHKLISDTFPEIYRISKQCWIVSVRGLTAQAIAKKLGVSENDDDETGTQGIVVFRATPSYWGNASTELWDWLTAHIEKSDG